MLTPGEEGEYCENFNRREDQAVCGDGDICIAYMQTHGVDRGQYNQY